MPEKQPIPDNAAVLSHRLCDILQQNESEKFTISDLMDYFLIPEKVRGKKKEVYTGLRIDFYKRVRTAVATLEKAEKITLEFKKTGGSKRSRTIYIKYKPQNPTTNA